MTGMRGFRTRNRSPLIWIILAFFLAAYGPSAVFKWVWVDLRSVTVTPDLRVIADRVFRRDFTGSFTVGVRRASDSRLICAGSPQPPTINYKLAANAANPVSFGLWEWASLDEPWEVDNCLRRGLVAGETFYLNTCHLAYGPWGIMIARRCVQSNNFTPAAISK